LDQVIDFIKDKTRITDPEKIGKSLQELMPLPKHVLPIKDGLLDLTNGTMIPHNPKYFYLTYFPRQYIKGGKSKKFREFLDIIFKDDPEKDIKETQIYELIALILTYGYIPQGMS
jgi:phage/plasmid-associated DNA primase